MYMFCIKCGAKLEKDMTSCPVCGHPVKSADQGQTAAVRKKSSLPVIIAVLAAVLIAAGAACCFFVIRPMLLEKQVNELIDIAEDAIDEAEDSDNEKDRRNAYEEAVSAFEDALELDSKNEDIYRGLIMAYVGMGDYDKAEEVSEDGMDETGSDDLEDYLEELISDREKEIESRTLAMLESVRNAILLCWMDPEVLASTDPAVWEINEKLSVSYGMPLHELDSYDNIATQTIKDILDIESFSSLDEQLMTEDGDEIWVQLYYGSEAGVWVPDTDLYIVSQGWEVAVTEPEPEPEPIPQQSNQTVMEAPSTDGWDESMKIYCYSWNNEFESCMQYVLDRYPEYEEYVEFVNLGVSGTDGSYQAAIDTALANDTYIYPSIIAMDGDIVRYYTETDDTLSMSELGITEDMYANMYQYTIDIATYNGELKAMTWQATPGCFIYRADIAEEVLGTSDPEEVQEYVKDWDSFYDTADAMRDAGYSMLSGYQDIQHVYWDQKTHPWITVEADGSEALTLDSSVQELFASSKNLYDSGYTNGNDMWSMEWTEDFEGDVFGYFGSSWFVYWTVGVWVDSSNSTYGDWRICAGPADFHWGGSWAAVMKDCPNPELAAFLLYSLCCDEDIMYTMACDTLDFANNQEVIEKEIMNGEGMTPVLGGQNPLEVWAEVAPRIDCSNDTYMDFEIESHIMAVVEEYVNGQYSSVGEAIKEVEDRVSSSNSNIEVK